MEKLQDAPYLIEETMALSVGELRARARRIAKENPGLALIVLDYPSQAVRKKLEGRVKLIMCVNAAGKPNSVSVVESSGHPVLDEAARKWFSRKARLKPAEATGTPVEVCNYTFEWT
jgi:TonB family protein